MVRTTMSNPNTINDVLVLKVKLRIAAGMDAHPISWRISAV
jgi:hypothetical protein